MPGFQYGPSHLGLFTVFLSNPSRELGYLKVSKRYSSKAYPMARSWVKAVSLLGIGGSRVFDSRTNKAITIPITTIISNLRANLQEKRFLFDIFMVPDL
jgi:hypothetical protein